MGFPMSKYIFYGDEQLSSSRLEMVEVLSKHEMDEEEEDPVDVFKSCFQENMGIDNFNELIRSKENIGIIINDRNRPTPTCLVLEFLLGNSEIVGKIGKIHIATGTHMEPADEDLKVLMGETYDTFADRIHIHVARDRDGHVPYGDTSRGTPLFFDKELEGHDLYIFVNSVEPHYFAGFTGGRKSIIPGMAYYGTVEKNHSHALSSGSRTLGLEGNPVHEDMEEAARIFLKGKEHLSIQIVQGPGKIITDAKVGDIFNSFRDAVKSAQTKFCLPVERTYDIVISVARSPMDRTLYQAQKAIENGKLVLKDGGVLLLVARCPEGIGQSTFWDLLTMSDDPEEILRIIDEGYVLGYHKAAKIVQLSQRSHIFALTEIPPEELARGFITGFSDLDEALKKAMKITGKDPSILLIPDGTVTVPYVKK